MPMAMVPGGALRGWGGVGLGGLGWPMELRVRGLGVVHHLASSEVAGSPQTLAQRKWFEEAIAVVAAAGLRPAWVHAGNSSTLDNQGAEDNLAWLRSLAASVGARSMVRAGIALYG